LAVDPNTVEIVVLIASSLGAFGRAMFPYLRKLKEEAEANKPVKFEAKYVISAIFSAVVASIVGLTLFPSLVSQVGSQSTMAGVFITSLLAGWGAGSLINNVIASGTNAIETEKKKTT